MTQRILITGSSGFTGRYMSRKLQDMGFEIWGLGKIKETSLAGVNMIEGDLTQPQSLSAAVESCQPHYVIHLAGVAFVGHNSPTAFYNVNLIGTHHLLQALSTHASRLKCVLLASSANLVLDKLKTFSSLRSFLILPQRSHTLSLGIWMSGESLMTLET
jgi:nucleoside-diphosphate-sugar epimerase